MRYFLPALLFAMPLTAAPVRVGKYAAKIVPEQVAALNFTAKGTVTDLANAAGRLEAGAVVAVLNKDETEEAREDMELALERETLAKNDEIRKLQAQRRKVAFYLQLTDEEKRYAAEASESEGLLTQETLRDIDARIRLLERELATAQRRKRKEFDLKHRDLTLRMPFAGRLQYNVPLPAETDKPLEYSGGQYQSFATVCDDSAFYVTISISNSDLTQLPENDFSVSVSLPGREPLCGTFSHRKVERANSGGDMLVYFFRLPQEEHETAYSMLGSNCRAELYFEAGEGVQSVSKAALAADPRSAECEDWQQLVQAVHPGYSIVIIAEREIIIRKN